MRATQVRPTPARSRSTVVIMRTTQATRTTRESALEVSGPYHLVRHPIYLGWLLIVFGAPEMTWTRFEFALVSSAYLFAAVPFEEKSLVDVFGDAYREYQRRTSMFVPLP